jgi:VWFA-related protein
VVRDKSGNPVVGLTKDDFELYENGVKQPISNFYEIRRQSSAPEVSDSTKNAEPSPAPPELRERRYVLFIDISSVQQGSKRRVLEAVQKFIDNHVKDDDQMMIVSWRLGLQVITPFTHDREALKRGLAALTRLAPGTDATRRTKRQIQDYYELASQGLRGYTWEKGYSDSLDEINAQTNAMLSEQQGLLNALRRIESAVAGLEGKKVLVFIGETMPVRPGAELYQYAYNLFWPHLSSRTLMPMEVMTGVAGQDMPMKIEAVAKTASADGVTMYTIGTADENSEFSADTDIVVDRIEASSRISNTASALNEMAEITGGVSINRTTNFDLAFDTVAHDLDSYYSLGYRPPNDASAASRKIAVKAKNHAYSVRTRETLVLKSADDQMNDRVVANLYSDGLASTWPIAVRTGTPKRDGRTFVIPIQVIMPSTLTLLPQDGSLVGGLVLYVVVGSADGQTSDVVRHPQGLKIPPAAETAIRAKPMTYTTGIRVKGGESTLSIAVLDQVSGAMGFARAKITAR